LGSGLDLKVLSENDIKLISMLYSPDIMPGMKIDEAASILNAL